MAFISNSPATLLLYYIFVSRNLNLVWCILKHAKSLQPCGKGSEKEQTVKYNLHSSTDKEIDTNQNAKSTFTDVVALQYLIVCVE